jgi:peptide/nickel transport system permease protein
MKSVQHNTVAASPAVPPTTEALSAAAHQRSRRRRLIRKHLRGIIGLAIIVPIILAALLAPVLPLPDPIGMSLPLRLKPPVWQEGSVPGYLLGTDQLGRDLLTRVIFGSRISLSVSAITVSFALLVGVSLGLYAGYTNGWLATLIMRIVDVQMAFPWLVLALVVITALGANFINVVIVLILVNWPVYCRVVRAQTMALKEQEFVLAARAVGGTALRIMVLHILPLTIPVILVLATYQLGVMIVAEAALSFLGMGVQPPTPSWGSIISDGRLYVEQGWWISTFSGLALMVSVLGIGLLGDWLRQILDPTLRI